MFVIDLIWFLIRVLIYAVLTLLALPSAAHEVDHGGNRTNAIPPFFFPPSYFHY